MLRMFVMAATIAVGAGAAFASEPPITLRDMGSFHVGGRHFELSGRPVREVVFTPGSPPARIDPNGVYMVEQMYAQYFLPAERRGRFPLLLWHGGGLSGVSYETTPDGRQGWLNWFVRRGWDTYVSDAVERGRAGWAMFPDVFQGEPIFLPMDNPFERFRIGAGDGSYRTRTLLPGNQFPLEGYENFTRQLVPRWTTTDAQIIRGYQALVDRVGESILLVHSQAGQFGWRVAQTRPNLVRALILIEPSGIGDPALAAATKDIPTLAIFGDFIEQDPRWPAIKRRSTTFFEQVRAAGGSVDVIDLPAIGIRGNSHMIMMDRNNLQVAEVIQRWLVEKGLWR